MMPVKLRSERLSNPGDSDCLYVVLSDIVAIGKKVEETTKSNRRLFGYLDSDPRRSDLGTKMTHFAS